MRVGDLDAAQAITLMATDFAATRETPTAQGNSLYCRGVLGHDAPLLLTAAERYDRAGRPLLQAMALESAGAAHAEAGDLDRARAALTSAIRVYTGLGARADAARAEAALSGGACPS